MALTVTNHVLASRFGNGAITATLSSFVDSTDVPFTSALVTAFPNVGIVGAGAAGADLKTTITFVNTSTVTTAAAAGTTQAAANWAWGNSVCDSNAAGTILSMAFGAQAAGATTVLAVVFDPTVSISSITDLSGNVYVLKASGTSAALYSISIYVASGIAAASAGANTVTVTFSAAAADAVIESFEVASTGGFALGVDVAVAGVATGSSTTPSSGSFSTKYTSEVVFAFTGGSHTVTAGTATWTVSGNDPYNNRSEYKIFAAKTTTAATFTMFSTGTWIEGFIGIAELPPLEEEAALAFTPPNEAALLPTPSAEEFAGSLPAEETTSATLGGSWTLPPEPSGGVPSVGEDFAGVWTFLEQQKAFFFTHGAITATQVTFVCSDAPFTGIDNVNHFVSVVGAGAGAGHLDAKITAKSSTSSITVSTPAGTTVAAANWAFGSTSVDTDGATTIRLALSTALVVGDLICVWSNAGSDVASVVDSANNSYKRILTNAGAPYTQVVYWTAVTQAAAAGATITITFTNSTVANGMLGFYHFAPPAGKVPALSQSRSATASSTAVNSGNITTQYPFELAIAATGVAHIVTATAAGWTATPTDKYGDISEFITQPAAGTTFAATATQATGNWVMFIVSFVAAFPPAEEAAGPVWLPPPEETTLLRGAGGDEEFVGSVAAVSLEETAAVTVFLPPWDAPALPPLADEEFAGALPAEEGAALVMAPPGEASSSPSATEEEFGGAHPTEETSGAVFLPPWDAPALPPLADEEFAGSLPAEEQASATFGAPLEPLAASAPAEEQFGGAHPTEEGAAAPIALGPSAEGPLYASLAEEFAGALPSEETATWRPPAPGEPAAPPAARDEEFRAAPAGSLPLEEAGAAAFLRTPILPPALRQSDEEPVFAPVSPLSLEEEPARVWLPAARLAPYRASVDERLPPGTPPPPTPVSTLLYGGGGDEFDEWGPDEFAAHASGVPWEQMRDRVIAGAISFLPGRSAPLAGRDRDTDLAPHAPAKAEADYIVVPVGPYGSEVRAAASGRLNFVVDDTKGGLCATIVGDNGNRYLHVGLGEARGSARWVAAGEWIGLVGRLGAISDAAVAQSVASAKAEIDVVSRYQFDTLFVGSCVSLVFLVLGQPELAVAIFVGALLVRASHEKR